MTAACGIAVAVTFVWSGLVIGISFIETPLKFRAPGVTVEIGLGIGRLVFRALNAVEIVLAFVLVTIAWIEHPHRKVFVAGAIALTSLAVQVAVVRPGLTRRSDAVLEGMDGPRSRAHYVYVGVELVKLGALLATGVLLLVTQ